MAEQVVPLDQFLTDRYHQEGCPQDPSRVESRTSRATTGKFAGRVVEIVRCVDCGGQRERPKQ